MRQVVRNFVRSTSSMAAAKRSTLAMGQLSLDNTSQPQSKFPKTARQTVGDPEYATVMAEVTKVRLTTGRSISLREKIDIIAVQANLRHMAAKKRQKPGKPAKHNFAKETANLLGRSVNVCRETWKEFIEGQDITVAEGTQSARGVKHRRIHLDLKQRADFREWLHLRNMKHDRTVANDVKDWLQQTGLLICDDSALSNASATRCVQRFIVRMGLSRGKRPGHISYHERQEVLAQRDAYVVRMLQVRKQRRLVYMDESYVHHHYGRHQDTLYDSEDTRPVPKRQHKGSRFCFIAAILSEDPAVDPIARQPCHEAQFMPETLDIFQGRSNKKGKP